MRKRPSPAIVIACVALFFSLTGAGLAAGHYLITSKSQIDPSVLKSLHGKRGLPGADGAPGAAGAAGATGATGATGVFSASDITVVPGPQVTLCDLNTGINSGTGCEVGTSTATCPAGSTVISGGYTGNLIAGAIDVSEPSGDSWVVVAGNDAAISLNFTAIAVCAT